MLNPNIKRGIAIVSALLGILSLVVGSILVVDLSSLQEKCRDPDPDLGPSSRSIITRSDMCNPVRGDLAVSCLSIAGGVFQIISAIIINCRIISVSENTGRGTYIAGFLLALISFVVSIYYNSSDIIKDLRTDRTWNSRLLFFYCITGINMVYCFGAIIATRVIKWKADSAAQEQPKQYPDQGSIRKKKCFPIDWWEM